MSVDAVPGTIVSAEGCNKADEDLPVFLVFVFDLICLYPVCTVRSDNISLFIQLCVLCKCNQEDEAQENKIKMKMVEKSMEQQKENMEHLKSLKVEAENKYDAIKLKVNQLADLADPLKVCPHPLVCIHPVSSFCIHGVLSRHRPNRT